jgi:PAS domain S-box-containing protein
MNEDRFEAISPDTEPGMNFISADFDLVMVNRANERLYAKSMVALLGKKCYREFEKRDEPCPHCPGRLALATGEAHEAETEGLRDDGTRFAARVRAHPVMGPDNRPTGFIEVVEDITEQKRAESLARISADLRAALLASQNVPKALRELLDAALRVEAIDSGCVLLIDKTTGKHTLVLQRNLAPECVKALTELSVESTAELRAAQNTGPGTALRAAPGAESRAPASLPASLGEVAGAPRSLAVIPILHRGQLVAMMIVGASTYPDIPASLQAGLRSLGATAGSAVSRIRAEQARGDAVADLEAVISLAPVATMVLDTGGRITMWNKAAERLFGWKASQILNRLPPFAADDPDGGFAQLCTPGPYETSLPRRDGAQVEVRLAATSFRDLVGGASTTIVMAEDLTLEKRVAQLEERLAASELAAGAGMRAYPGGAAGGDPVGAAEAGSGARVLVIDACESSGAKLIRILSALGYEAARFGSPAEAAPAMTAGATEGRPFALAIVDMIAPDGSNGLDQRAALRGLGFEAPVIVCGDSDIRGHEQHGFAAAIRRPYDPVAVERAIRAAL